MTLFRPVALMKPTLGDIFKWNDGLQGYIRHTSSIGSPICWRQTWYANKIGENNLSVSVGQMFE